MKIIGKECSEYGRGYDVYKVIVNDWKNTEEQNDAILLYCDSNCFGGRVWLDRFLHNGDMLLEVKVYTD